MVIYSCAVQLNINGVRFRLVARPTRRNYCAALSGSLSLFLSSSSPSCSCSPSKQCCSVGCYAPGKHQTQRNPLCSVRYVSPWEEGRERGGGGREEEEEEEDDGKEVREKGGEEEEEEAKQPP